MILIERGSDQDFDQYCNTIFIFIKDTNVPVSAYGLCDLVVGVLFHYSQFTIIDIKRHLIRIQNRACDYYLIVNKNDNYGKGDSSTFRTVPHCNIYFVLWTRMNLFQRRDFAI